VRPLVIFDRRPPQRSQATPSDRIAPGTQFAPGTKFVPRDDVVANRRIFRLFDQTVDRRLHIVVAVGAHEHGIAEKPASPLLHAPPAVLAGKADALFIKTRQGLSRFVETLGAGTAPPSCHTCMAPGQRDPYRGPQLKSDSSGMESQDPERGAATAPPCTCPCAATSRLRMTAGSKPLHPQYEHRGSTPDSAAMWTRSPHQIHRYSPEGSLSPVLCIAYPLSLLGQYVCLPDMS
jgi:hypothetical protein